MHHNCEDVRSVVNTRLKCAATFRLSNWHSQLMPISGNFEPRVLLDLARLHRNAGNVEAQNFLALNINQFGRVESPCHSIQSAHQGTLGRAFLIEPVTFSAAGPIHPLEVPSLLANHRIENWCRDFCHESPHRSPTGFLRGSRRSGRMHSLRRKTECGFTLARFSIL